MIPAFESETKKERERDKRIKGERKRKKRGKKKKRDCDQSWRCDREGETSRDRESVICMAVQAYTGNRVRVELTQTDAYREYTECVQREREGETIHTTIYRKLCCKLYCIVYVCTVYVCMVGIAQESAKTAYRLYDWRKRRETGRRLVTRTAALDFVCWQINSANQPTTPNH